VAKFANLVQYSGAFLIIMSMLLIGRETSLEIEDWEAWLFDESQPQARPDGILE